MILLKSYAKSSHIKIGKKLLRQTHVQKNLAKMCAFKSYYFFTI